MTSKASTRKPERWTDKERLFAHEYLIDQCQAAAARRAGYSLKTADRTGHEVYHRPHVKAWIEERIALKLKELDITIDKVLQEMAELGFMKRDEVLAAGRSPDDDLPAPVTLSSTMRMTDKIRALELVGKHLKMWTDKVETNDNRPTVVIRDLTGKKKKGAE